MNETIAWSQAKALGLKRYFSGKCALCKCSIKIDYHADHITPLKLGGTNWIKNIQLLCPPCNMSKSAKDPLAYAREIGRLL